MVIMSKRAIALCAAITLVLVAAADLAQGRHTDAASGSVALSRHRMFAPRPASAVPAVSNEQFEARWSGGESWKVAERLPESSEPADPVRARPMAPARETSERPAKDSAKGDRLSGHGRCGRQTWPYISGDCIAADDRATAPRQVRVITIEHRPDLAASVVARRTLPAVSALR